MISRALNNVLFVSRVNGTFRRKNISEKSLLPSHQMMISFICRHEGCSQDMMVMSMGLDKSMVARRIAELEKMEYVYRQISPQDARVRLVYPTEKAKELYPEIHIMYSSFTDQVLDGLTEEEIETLNTISEKMRANAERILNDMNKK